MTNLEELIEHARSQGVGQLTGIVLHEGVIAIL
ncbi:hypothetical protein FHW64_006406 [Variovorax sp. Sphag1AA]|nr:hypothetical protein [Variovorax sp. Sphag1AA]